MGFTENVFIIGMDKMRICINRNVLLSGIFILCCILFCGCSSVNLPEIKYHVKTEAPIEKQFLESGPYRVNYFSTSANDFKLKNYHVWYPSELENGQKKYPLIVICNGTGYRATRFASLFKHLASWGFTVIGTEEEWSGKGRGAILSLRFMLSLNKKKESIFYQKIDLEKIGIAGHSQGGAGAINAITKYPEGHMFKTLFSISGVRQEQADSWLLRCAYDPGLLRVPVMMTATSNPYGWDEVNPERPHLAICPLESMQKNKADILKNFETTIIIARVAHKRKYHADNLAMSTPYMTAWFSYWLKGEKQAGGFFLGSTPELKQNPCWQDVEIHEG